ncbi:MAG TPA: class I SAM-dependent methyltransferase [Puia sp.]|nr:class I SAM-dependent methyltransferase [Puia sp.]
MQESHLPFLRCPVSRTSLQLHIISKTKSPFGSAAGEIISEGILFAAADWFFPVIGGIPRLTVEAFHDYADFFRLYLPDYLPRRQQLEQKYPGLIAYVKRKNRKTRKTFSREWSLFNYQEDRTWEATREEMLNVFLKETDESADSLKGKMIFDAGCGNGLLDQLIAGKGAITVAMDLSNSIERAYQQNTQPGVFFIQGDVQFPPLDFCLFDIVHSSGVLHHTNNSELSFSCLEPCARSGGKLSVWLYHPRKNFLHNLFNRIRSITSKLPSGLQYFLLRSTFLPISYVIKRLKGNRQNKREMMIALLDWFSPEFRREHTPDEAAGWFAKRGYTSVKVTTTGLFGFSIIGRKG